MMMQMVASFAEFERAMIRERTSAGLAAARAEGRIGGRRKKLERFPIVASRLWVTWILKTCRMGESP
jgi:DNA invertase Pin-like site-specific DNA recombinase